MEITIKQKKPYSLRYVEFVERKGVGHPDTLIDGIADEISLSLSKEYMEKAGTILHHNVDKGLIVGGSTIVKFGGGEIKRKIEVIVAGRAMESYNGIKFNISEIAKETAKTYLKTHTRLDVNNDVEVISKIYNGSSDLTGLFERNKEIPLANDTSFGVGYYPLSETENLTLQIEKFLNSKEYKERKPEVGEDIKVMALRRGNKINVVIAIAFISKYINSIDAYFEAKGEVKKDVEDFTEKLIGKKVKVEINTADSRENGEIYMTKTGLSCEAGDDGSVGRGNRANGLITPFRYMSLEAVAGKNPVNHIGKIYNILATEIAKEIVEKIPSVAECNVSMLSKIGTEISQPQDVYVDVAMKEKKEFKEAKAQIDEIVKQRLSNINSFIKDMAIGKYKIG